MTNRMVWRKNDFMINVFFKCIFILWYSKDSVIINTWKLLKYGLILWEKNWNILMNDMPFYDWFVPYTVHTQIWGVHIIICLCLIYKIKKTWKLAKLNDDNSLNVVGEIVYCIFSHRSFSAYLLSIILKHSKYIFYFYLLCWIKKHERYFKIKEFALLKLITYVEYKMKTL